MPKLMQYSNQSDPMDLWFDSQGLYRKAIARDGSCLFRAIAEQIYFTQQYHMLLRKECIEYLKQHPGIFAKHKGEERFEDYLELMKSSTHPGGICEIIAASEIHKLNIVIFKDVGAPGERIGNMFEQQIMLCSSYECHYDSVYLKTYIKDAGFCQSLVYDVLYSKVFGIKDIEVAVDKMLHYKSGRHRGEHGSGGQRKFNFCCNSIAQQKRGFLNNNFTDDEVDIQDLLSKGITPFPYKVAKSLDPNIFRNVEYDVWVDYRKGLRHGYFGSNSELRIGVKCHVKMDDKTYVGHIQEMSPDKGPVVVFVEELGEKHTVLYEDLELLPQDLILKPHIPHSYRCRLPATKPPPLCLQDVSNPALGGSKQRKGKYFDDTKGKTNSVSPLNVPPPQTMTSGRVRKSYSNTSDENETDTVCGYQNYSFADGYNTLSGFHTYQGNMEMSALAVPIQTHFIVQQQPSQQPMTPPVLVPYSPCREDIPPSWLSARDVVDKNNSLSGSGQPASPTDFFRFGSYLNSQSTPIPEVGEPIQFAEADKDQSFESGVELDANSSSGREPTNYGQVNFNVSRSEMESGSDLPLSDIPTLRYFFNLGHNVYHSQYAMYGPWSYQKQQCNSSFTPICNNTACGGTIYGGKCSCGPVCIAAVPTIHNLFEPSTPPANGRSSKQDTANDTENKEQKSTSGRSSNKSFQSSNIPPRFKKDSQGKGKRDPKLYTGQPLVQPVTSSSPHSQENGTSTHSRRKHLSPAGNNDASNGSSISPPTLTIPCPQTCSYVYYPSSPVAPYSPIDTFPLQFAEYSSDPTQSPQCFSLSGTNEMGIYGSSPQFSFFTGNPSPHFFVNSSPGIYMGSPPIWTPVTPTTPQP